MNQLLNVNDLCVCFDTPSGTVWANKGITLTVNEGESTGIMGESGCGKTVFFLSLLRLQQPGQIVRGSIVFEGQELTAMSEKAMQRIRGRQVALIPQNHATALNPSFIVGDQLQEAVRVREKGGSLRTAIWNGQRRDREPIEEIESVLGDLGVGDKRNIRRVLSCYSHQLSGGIRQRVLIAMALLYHPRLLIADEPSTALDRATRMQTLHLLRTLQRKITMLVISHDYFALSCTCNRVAIMYGGRVVEQGKTGVVFGNPLHPYTKLLISSQRSHRGEKRPTPVNDALDLITFPQGCSFHPWCPEGVNLCSIKAPQAYSVKDREVACHLYSGDSAR